MKTFLCFLALIVSIPVSATTVIERVKVTGFHCQNLKLAISLRSFESDRTLYFTQADAGEVPEELSLMSGECEALARNFTTRFKGRVFDATFLKGQFSRSEQVYIPPKIPCDEFRQRKCSYEGHHVDKTVSYQFIETTIEGYRFFKAWQM